MIAYPLRDGVHEVSIWDNRCQRPARILSRGEGLHSLNVIGFYVIYPYNTHICSARVFQQMNSSAGEHMLHIPLR